MKPYALLAATLLVTCSVIAQDSEEATRGADGGTRVHVSGIKILPAPERPFSGRDYIEWTRTLEDGTIISSHLYAFLARDSQGRIYRERVSFVPANSDQKSRRREFILSDPVTHTRTICVVATRHCDITNYHAPTSFKLQPVGPFDEGKRNLAREALGSDFADGLKVVGTLETITINAGVVGNNQPLVSTREFWYSPDLRVNLSVTRKDPRQGTQAIKVVDLSRAEPDGAIFQVPAGYVVQDRRPESPKADQ